MTHFTHIADLGPVGVAELLNEALAWKQHAPSRPLQDAILGMVFFNPSLRTRTSFEAAMIRGGGQAIVLEVGGGVWKLESKDGVVMDSDRAEHLREAVPVLSRFVDLLAVRTFLGEGGAVEEEEDPIINGFRRHATVPLISMESAREHPCQGLADLLTLRETFGQTQGLDVTLAWAPHIRPLPRAVPNSFLLTAAAAGCHVRITHPEGFELAPSVMAEAERYAREAGGSVSVVPDRNQAIAGSAALYAKAWGPLVGEAPTRQLDWMVRGIDLEGLRRDGIFLHCLPLRRNVEIADEVLDGPRSRVVDQAENRFHVQRVALQRLWRSR